MARGLTLDRHLPREYDPATMIAPLSSPWENTLLRLVSEAQSSLRIASPFVKASALERALDAAPRALDVHLVSSVKMACFHRGASDVAAFRRVIDGGGHVTNLPRLHAKVYLFDERRAVVTSGNLTDRGLRYAQEYGLLVEEEGLVTQIAQDFSRWCTSEEAAVVAPDALDEIEGLLKALPQPEPMVMPKLPALPGVREVEDRMDLLTSAEANAVAKTMVGWTRDTFDVIASLPAQFGVEAVYAFAPTMAQRHPENQHIEAKLRQQLQRLRDLGLVEFLGGGRYRRLWT